MALLELIRWLTWSIFSYGYVSMPSWAWVVTSIYGFCRVGGTVSMPSRAWVVTWQSLSNYKILEVSMPSRAWVVTRHRLGNRLDECCFNALTGLSCYIDLTTAYNYLDVVSMPSRAWVVTARMSNILNFLWYFLCIPAIYKCILAYLSIFFNQLSEFLRCESPSTFLGTCLSHHFFIIFLVTSTNALLTGLYLISTRLIFI